MAFSNFTLLPVFGTDAPDTTEANLISSDLSEADLRNANLSAFTVVEPHGDLRNAKIGGAILTGASLTGVDLTGATGTPIYAGVDLSTVTCPDGTLASTHGNTCTGHPWA